MIQQSHKTQNSETQKTKLENQVGKTKCQHQVGSRLSVGNMYLSSKF